MLHIEWGHTDMWRVLTAYKNNENMSVLPIRPLCLPKTFLSSSLGALESLFHFSTVSMFRLLRAEAHPTQRLHHAL